MDAPHRQRAKFIFLKSCGAKLSLVYDIWKISGLIIPTLRFRLKIDCEMLCLALTRGCGFILAGYRGY